MKLILISLNGVRLSSVISPTGWRPREAAGGAGSRRESRARASSREKAGGPSCRIASVRAGSLEHARVYELSATVIHLAARTHTHTHTHAPRARDISGRSPFFPRAENTGGERAREKFVGERDFRAEMSPSATSSMCRTPSPLDYVSLFSDRSANRATRVPSCDSQGVPPRCKLRIVAYRLSCGIREGSATKESIALVAQPVPNGHPEWSRDGPRSKDAWYQGVPGQKSVSIKRKQPGIQLSKPYLAFVVVNRGYSLEMSISKSIWIAGFNSGPLARVQIVEIFQRCQSKRLRIITDVS